MNELTISGTVIETPDYRAHPRTRSVLHGKITHKISLQPYFDAENKTTMDFIAFRKVADALKDAQLHKHNEVVLSGLIRSLGGNVMLQVIAAGTRNSEEDGWETLV